MAWTTESRVAELNPQGTVTVWIEQVKGGCEQASRRIWDFFFQRLVALARKNMAGTPRAVADEEDVVLSAFDSVFRRAKNGEFSCLFDRDDLWHILALVTRRKAIDLIKFQKRKKRSPGKTVSLNSGGPAFADTPNRNLELADSHPPGDLILQFAEEFEHLLELLKDEPLREIALWKLEGYTNGEIAQRLGCVERTVERKLWLIKMTWTKALEE